jgi:hypothetical protein
MDISEKSEAVALDLIRPEDVHDPVGALLHRASLSAVGTSAHTRNPRCRAAWPEKLIDLVAQDALISGCGTSSPLL